MIGTSSNDAVHGPAQRSGTAAAGGREQQPGAAPPSTNGVNGAHNAADGAPGAAGRDARGQFVRGNAGGPGNPFARRVARLRRTLCETVTDEDIQAVARALIEKAKQGDVAAARVLLSYTIGQPAPAVDPDTLDLAEWDIYRRTPANLQDLEALVGGMPVTLACKLAGIVTPCVQERAARALGAELGTDGAVAGASTGGAPVDAPRAGADQKAAPPSTNGANGRRASPPPLARRRPKRVGAAKRTPARPRIAARQRRAGSAAPATNGKGGNNGNPSCRSTRATRR